MLIRAMQVVVLSALAGLSARAQTAADFPAPQGCDVIAKGTGGSTAEARVLPFPPTQLEVRTPAAPTLFAAAGRDYLLYELYLSNFSDEAMTVRGVEILNADDDKMRVVSVLDEARVKERLRMVGGEPQGGATRLGAGQGAIVSLCLAFDKTAAPAKLRHRVLLDGAFADGPAIATRSTRLQVLGPPLTGSDWTADNGPSLHSHHRKGVFVAGGLARNARRYALDWKIYRDGEIYRGDARDVRAYHAYGRDVIAVAGGWVVGARNGMPDNIPRTKDGFTPAVPMTMDNLAGNFVVVDLGNGQYAQYAHLQPGSVLVKTGSRVRKGQLIARVGNSGDARVPHLHFQVTTGTDILDGEGLPYLIDRFRMRVGEGKWEVRTREYPLDGAVVDFGAD
ncbi:Peptidase family M23 [Duganella sp. CF517]|uniref:M23 family metallopeptidase n=1 Tax=Duganella sp. CF517 TaxID=1881038 RepID=UPI0008CB32EF|nr:M23 family metallopeptidase [Duganella sp. CF517]SEN92553.1 Peptidase family M23 [Duganella sp. CF517]